MQKPGRILTDLTDPRGANTRHRLGDLIVIAVASALCGGATCVDFAQFAQSKHAVLREVLGPFRPPSHDTFSRVFRRLDPDAFARQFSLFAACFAKSLSGVVAIDGKALRRAHEAGLQAAPPLMVTAWATEARIALAGVMPDRARGGNEVSAAMAVLDLLDLKGTVVTADALHCHRAMAAKVLERGADYALCLKGNRMKLVLAARALLEHAPPHDVAETSAVAHGRAEKRNADIVLAPDFARLHAFDGVKAVARVTTQRGTAKPHTRLFLLSKPFSARAVLDIVRAHWDIENGLHWNLDVTLSEDTLRSRKDNAPATLAFITRAALNILSAINDPATPKRRRVLRCAWEDDYLRKALAHMR